jgi:hypothetical protein
MSLTPAEQFLQQLGVTEPGEIDIEAIAYYAGARVRYQPLDGCDARIIGRGNAAIITVNAKSQFRRKRFSIAHELGHWHHHRGQSLVCRVDDYRQHNMPGPERVADAYAADLLMPNYLFHPLACQQSKLSFKAVAALAGTFNTSHTATAIRLVENDQFPAVLVCHGRQGRKWFFRAPSVPDHWIPKHDLDADSSAIEVLFGGKPDDSTPVKVGAGAWFSCREAPQYEIHEQTMRISEEEVLTLLLFNNSHMLQERENPTRSRNR